MFNFRKDKIEKPVKMDKFDIPVLFKKVVNSFSMVNYSEHLNYIEAATDGFFYEKDNVKYFRVKEMNKFSNDMRFKIEKSSKLRYFLLLMSFCLFFITTSVSAQCTATSNSSDFWQEQNGISSKPSTHS